MAERSEKTSTTKTNKQVKKAYRLEIDNAGCPHCNARRTWVIIDPDDISSGTSYGQEEEAQDICDDLNSAFEKGQTDARKS